MGRAFQFVEQGDGVVLGGEMWLSPRASTTRFSPPVQ
jgi:hypothetical protein